MTRIHVTPAPIDAKKPGAGRLSIPSPDHANQPLPDGGDFVTASDYWSRRIYEGAVIHDPKKIEPSDDAPAAKSKE